MEENGEQPSETPRRREARYEGLYVSENWGGRYVRAKNDNERTDRPCLRTEEKRGGLYSPALAGFLG